MSAMKYGEKCIFAGNITNLENALTQGRIHLSLAVSISPTACTISRRYCTSHVQFEAITGHLCNWLRTLACTSNLATILF